MVRFEKLKLLYFREMCYFDNFSLVILSNGERKYEFGEILGMWFFVKFDSFLFIFFVF